MAQTWQQTDDTPRYTGDKCASGTDATNVSQFECQIGGSQGSGTNTSTLPAKQSYIVAQICTDSDVEVTSIPAGTWDVNLYVSTAAASGSYFDRVDICRLDSEGTSQATIASWTGSTACDSTGSKLIQVTQGSAHACSVTDCFYVVVHAFCNAHAGTTLGLTFSETIVDTITIDYEADATKGAVVVAGYGATVTLDNITNCTKGAVTVAALAATIPSADITSATKGAVAVAALGATVNASTIIECALAGVSVLVDSKSAPAHLSTYNSNADCHINVIWTNEAGTTMTPGLRYSAWNSRVYVECRADGTDDLRLYWNDGSAHLVNQVTGIFTADQEYEVDIYALGSNIKVDVDGVNKLDETVSYNQTQTSGEMRHTLASNDIELKSYSWPAGGVSVDGYAATVTLDNITNCTKGAVVVAAYAADVPLADTTSATKGAVVVASLAATVNASQNIVCTKGAVVVAPKTATVTLDNITNATKGAVVVAPKTATISADQVIDCTKGAVVVASYAATVTLNSTISCTKGSVAAASYAATISADQSISCTKGAVTVAGYAASVETGNQIDATKGAVVVVGYAATVETSDTTNATKGAVAVAGLNSTVSTGLIVDCTTGAVLIPNGSTLVDSKSAPADQSTYDTNADCHINVVWTNEAGTVMSPGLRYSAWNSRVYVECRADGTDDLRLYYHDGSANLVNQVTNVFTADQEYTVDIYALGSNIKVAVDGDTKLNETCSYNQTQTSGEMRHSLVSNDIELESYSWPSANAVTITLDNKTNCTKGAVVVAGLAASIPSGEEIDCTKGAVVVAAYAASVEIGSEINCTKGAVVVAGLAATVVNSQTYYYAEDGTAANKEAATTGTYPGGCMSPATCEGESYSAGDFILASDQGGDIRYQFNTLANGSAGYPITYGIKSGETPVLNGSEIITGWTLYSGDIWQAAVTTEPEQVWMDDNFGDRKTGTGSMSNQYDWYWASNVLYIWTGAANDPDTYYTSPGVEAAQRTRCISASNDDYIIFDGLTFTKSNDIGLFPYNSSDITVRNCTAEWCWVNGIAVGGSENHSDVVVEDCITRYNGTMGISISYTLTGIMTDFTVQRNICYENGRHQKADPLWDSRHMFTGGIKLWGNHNVHPGILITENECYDNGPSVAAAGGSYGNGIWFDELNGAALDKMVCSYNYSHDNNASGLFIENSSHVAAFGNLFIDNAAHSDFNAFSPAGVKILARQTRDAKDNWIYNNTIYGGNLGLQATHYNDDTGLEWSNNLYKNNIVSGCTTILRADKGAVNDGTWGTGNVYDNNCFGAEFTNFIYWDSSYYSTYDAWETAHAEAWTQVETDPSLHNVSADHYWLDGDSDCINAGDDLGADYDDALDHWSAWPNRVETLDQDSYGAGWEIGAYVYNPVTTGTVTIAAYAATIDTGVDITSCTLGTVAVADYNAAIRADDTTSCGTDTVAIASLAATVNASTQIVATTDTVTIAAFATTVPYNVYCAKGAVVVASYAASISAKSTIAATKGAVVVVGYAATVSVGTGITATKGAVVVTGYNTVVTTADITDATKGAVVVAGYTVTITVGNVTQAAKGAVVVAALDAMVPDNTGCAPGTVTIADYAATITLDNITIVSKGNVVVAGYAAVVNDKFELVATAGAVTIAGLDAMVIDTTNATLGTVAVAGYAATISADQALTATKGSVVIAGYGVTVESFGVINVTTGPVVIAGFDPEVTHYSGGEDWGCRNIGRQSVRHRMSRGHIRTVDEV